MTSRPGITVTVVFTGSLGQALLRTAERMYPSDMEAGHPEALDPKQTPLQQVVFDAVYDHVRSEHQQHVLAAVSNMATFAMEGGGV